MSTTSHGGGHGHGPGQSAEDFARSESAGHEVSDARTGMLVYAGMGVFILIIASFAAIALLLALAGTGVADEGHVLEDDPASALQLPPEPRLEQNPELDSTRLVEEANAQLEGYGWVNKRAGTAHIPIERAIELLVEKGVGPQGAQPQGSAPAP
jgi:hypothetical protein